MEITSRERNEAWMEFMKNMAKTKEKLTLPEFLGEEYCDDVLYITADGIRRFIYRYASCENIGTEGIRRYTIGIQYYSVVMGRRIKGKEDWLSGIKEIEIITRYVEQGTGKQVLLLIDEEILKIITGKYSEIIDEQDKKIKFYEEKFMDMREEINNLKETILKYADLESKIKDVGKDKSAGVSVSVEQPEKGKR